ncbi:MAG: arylsulfotransferase family protein [Pseudomonadota bacterium]
MDLSRLIFNGLCALLIAAAIFAAGFYSGLTRNWVYQTMRQIKDDVTLVLASREPAVKNFLQPNRGQGAGVTVNDRTDDALIMLSGFFEGGNEIRLIERDGTLVARWPLEYDALFPEPDFLQDPPRGNLAIDLHGALMEPDGATVFNFEYGGTAKLDRCGGVEWTLRHPTHHSIERAEDGGYWIAGRIEHRENNGAFPPFTSPSSVGGYGEDLILRVSDTGEIVEEVSVPRILLDGGLEAVLTATGHSFWPNKSARPAEIVHLNKITELPRALAPAFPMFEAGDLALSLRMFNMIAVVDPDSWAVKWHQTGPWIRQHDPEFLPDGRMAIFNNNAYRIKQSRNRVNLDQPFSTNIVLIDPASRRTEIAYGSREGQEMLSHVRGKHDPVPGGGFIITEFDAGRAVQVDREGRVVWEYVNEYDAENVAEITEARIYPRAYFSVSDWSCN